MRWLGIGYSKSASRTLGRQSPLKAYQMRNRASDVERFYIETLYDRHVTGNLERQQRTLETWAETYPARSGSSWIAGGFGHDEHRQIRAVDCRNR